MSPVELKGTCPSEVNCQWHGSKVYRDVTCLSTIQDVKSACRLIHNPSSKINSLRNVQSNVLKHKIK